jgi:hypothetical protein
MISINGVDLPTPSSYKIPQSDLDSSDAGRNEAGYLQRDRIRQGVYKVELEWKAIKSADADRILNAVKPSAVNATIFTTGGIKTKRMYVGDRDVSIARYWKKDDVRWDVSFNLIEY